MYAKGSLSTHMANLLKIQKEMMERHKQIIQKGDKTHSSDTESTKYTVFDIGSYVFLEPATGKPKDRLHSRKLGPFLVLTDNTNNLQNLDSMKEFEVNIKRIHPFHFDEERVNPQEIASHDSDEFIVESILSHTGDFKKKNSLLFHVCWLRNTPAEDTWEPWKNVMHVEKVHTYLRSIGLEKMVPKYLKSLGLTLKIYFFFFFFLPSTFLSVFVAEFTSEQREREF